MFNRSTSRWSTRSTGLALALTVAPTIIGLPFFAGTAGATMGCGEYSFGFAGTRLLNDGISHVAGPFTIELPADTYDVIMQSHDAHDEHPGQTEQTEEQWYFVLDSGYQSPLTVDIPDDQNLTVTVVENQMIASDTTSITVHHRGVGSVNSVDVVCVGFTPVEEPVILSPIVEEPSPLPDPEPEPPVQVGGATAEPPAQLALTGAVPVTYWLVAGAVVLLLAGFSLAVLAGTDQQ